MVNVPSITDDRLLTTSYSTDGKSPEAFYFMLSVSLFRFDKYTYILLGWLLPIEESNRIGVFQVKRNQLYVSLRQILFLQAIYQAFFVPLGPNLSI